ncbi:DNA mismatch repair protein MutS [Myxococcota bacterium]|nr:DNA mismatch repair protein MutS [Myxococcota bacterium]
MMQQFLKVKALHPDAIVFYRMGDFYEMFLEDAERAAPLLDIALTTRDKGKPDAVPMCGVPVHAADAHIKRLAELGHRVAICEQVEDPRELGGRRLVRREVVEVVTPGLVGDPEGLDGRTVVALAALCLPESSSTETDPSSPARRRIAAGGDDVLRFGLAVLDASTGDFRATELAVDARALVDGELLPEPLVQELSRIAPREILIPAWAVEGCRGALERVLGGVVVSAVGSASFDALRSRSSWPGMEQQGGDQGTRAARAVANYLAENQPFAVAQPPLLTRYALADTVVLDTATRRHLELFENGEDRGRAGTLIAELDLSCGALGARRLARWLGYPLRSPRQIGERQDAVAALFERDRLRSRLRDALAGVRDLERLLAKAVRPGAVPRDLGALRASLRALPRVALALHEGDDPAGGDWLGAAPGSRLPLEAPEPLPELLALLEEALVDDPPVIARGSRGAQETGYIREGYRSDLDALRESASKGREWIAGLEAEERERSGIASLKVRFHPVHGYAFEVAKSQLARIPADYERKQTLANVERFSTERLREVEARVMGATERAAKLEREIFESLRLRVGESSSEIRAAADRVAMLDALASFAEVARRKRWVRPEVDESEGLEIKAGRHPVIESVLGRRGADGFVPNDTRLDPAGTQILLLTGPNMSGKSTYLRQVALIVLLAQIGSFVPAESARVGIVDRVFTRVGASDRLARGESTFMVEMRETADILSQVTRRSLVILDEIGRGTSTFDGLSIAWAVAEYLHDTRGAEARTLFATHYHELVALAEARPRIANAHFEVREWNEEVIFLRRLVAGGASRSYGIQVARLAGLPQKVIERARDILHDLEGGSLPGGVAKPANRGREGQLSLALEPKRSAGRLAEQKALDALRHLDFNLMTPLDALTWLARAKEDLAAAARADGEEGAP